MSQCGQALSFADGFQNFLGILKADKSGWAARIGMSLRDLVPCELWNQEDLMRYHADALEDEVVSAGTEASRAPDLETQGPTILLKYTLRNGGEVCLAGKFGEKDDYWNWELTTP